MNVLLLGPDRTGLAEFISSGGDCVASTELPFVEDDPVVDWADRVVSFGYRHIVAPAIVERWRGRALNLHISLLPWNRGADPNVWSFLQSTPRGVTIHFIDEGVDEGDVLLQESLELGPPHTLRTSYEVLVATIDELFRNNWPRLREGAVTGTPQPPGGSVHRSADLDPYRNLLTDGWDTPVAEIEGAALRVHPVERETT